MQYKMASGGGARLWRGPWPPAPKSATAIRERPKSSMLPEKEN